MWLKFYLIIIISLNYIMRGYGYDIVTNCYTINKYCYNNKINETTTTDK